MLQQGQTRSAAQQNCQQHVQQRVQLTTHRRPVPLFGAAPPADRAPARHHHPLACMQYQRGSAATDAVYAEQGVAVACWGPVGRWCCSNSDSKPERRTGGVPVEGDVSVLVERHARRRLDALHRHRHCGAGRGLGRHGCEWVVRIGGLSARRQAVQRRLCACFSAGLQACPSQQQRLRGTLSWLGSVGGGTHRKSRYGLSPRRKADIWGKLGRGTHPSRWHPGRRRWSPPPAGEGKRHGCLECGSADMAAGAICITQSGSNAAAARQVPPWQPMATSVAIAEQHQELTSTR